MLIHNFFLIFMTNVLTIKVFNFSLLSLPELQVFNAGSLKALRAARVLRPLKLVSGIPSKSTKYVNIFTVRPVLPFHVQSQWWNHEMLFYNPGQKCWDSCTVQTLLITGKIVSARYYHCTSLPPPHGSFNIVLSGEGGGDKDL